MVKLIQHLLPYCVVAFIYLAVAADFWRSAKRADATDTLAGAFK